MLDRLLSTHKNIKLSNLVLSIAIMIAVINLDFTAMSILLNNFQTMYNITMDESQKIVSLYLIFAASFFIISGKIIDIFSPRKVYLIGITIFCFSFPIMLFNIDIKYVYIARCLQGISYPFIFNSGTILLNALLPSGRKLSGITIIMLISSIMQILGPGVAGMLIELKGWKSVFFCTGFAGILAAILFF